MAALVSRAVLSEPRSLDLQAALSALQGLLGRTVSVTVGGAVVPHLETWAGFAGVLGFAERPNDIVLQSMGDVSNDQRIFAFFVGSNEPFDRSWFILDERTFESGLAARGPAPDMAETLAISMAKGSIVIAVPTETHLREARDHD